MSHTLYEVDGHLGRLTLNRPDARNAYSDEMIDGLVAALDEAELDTAVRVIVLTGNGSCFNAGGDLKAMRDREGMFQGDALGQRARYFHNIHRAPRRMERFSKPIVAAVNGPAIGAGLDLACMCDVRIASEKAKFGSTFVKVGLVPGDGGAFALSRAIGFSRALELMLTGRVIGAARAEQMGLVSQVVPHEELMEAADTIALEIAANAPVAVQMTKIAAYRSWATSMDNALNLAASYQGIAHHTDDHQEGVAAILEKRRPEFKGK